jgi:hydrogenase expression/formation protein HypE
MASKKIILGHGSGGRLMHNLIRDLFLKRLNNPILNELTDAAVVKFKQPLAFTTDSFVVSPINFPGADIGKLSVCGTINDLVMLGAIPEYLSLAIIIEEGLDYDTLDKIIESISYNAKKAGVLIVTGDLKVVERGACDKIFINTSGIGRIIKNKKPCLKNIHCADKVIVTGEIGQHGIAVLSKIKELDLGFNVKSDCAPLNDLIIPILKKTDSVRFMRDPTRGGVATTLNEIAEGLKLGIVIDEKNIPVSSKVKAACELLGIDPLYVACEGRAILVVSPDSAEEILKLLKRHPLARNAQIIGTVAKEPKGRVVLNTIIGTQRIVDMLTSEPLPRIC